MPKSRKRNKQKNRKLRLTVTPNSRKKFRCTFNYIWSVQVHNPLVPGVQTIQANIPLNYPGYSIFDNGNGLGTYGQIAALGVDNRIGRGLLGITVGNPIFDEYKVNKLTCVFMPFNLETSASATGEVSTDVPVMYHYNDLDDISLLPATTLEGQMMSNGIFPRHLNTISTKGIKMVFSQPKEKRKVYLNTGNIGDLPTSAPSLQNTSMTNPFGSMKIAWQKLSAVPLTYIGKLYISWDVTCRGISSTYI